jgi:hypothetical protein
MIRLLLVAAILAVLTYTSYLGLTIKHISSISNNLLDELRCTQVDCDRAPAIVD